MGCLNRATTEGFLFTDQYQLTMAQLYFKAGMHRKRVLFDYFFRGYPEYGSHQAGYCVFAGLGTLLEWMQNTHVTPKDILFLKSQKTQTGKPFFSNDFLRWLGANGHFEGVSLRSVAEGRIVHPQVPLAVTEGPLAIAQILESSLLNHLNYQTLVATKACRIREAGGGQTLIEFGLRRGQARGAVEGARAALIGGADYTSNAGVSHLLGFAPKGTHAHSMVQVFIALGYGERQAFEAYADLYPDDCLLLVDTVNTLGSGIPNAIAVFEKLKRRGHRPVGIRLDSGDLAYLSIQAHKQLKAAGFPEAKIVLSNQLDEIVISQILNQIRQEAPSQGIDANDLIRCLIYGVGSRLLTSAGCSALDGVYKLTAVEKNKKWAPAIKLSETIAKTINPFAKSAWRLYDRRDKAIGDLIGFVDEKPQQLDPLVTRHPYRTDVFRRIYQSELTRIEPLLKPVWAAGKPVCRLPAIEEMRIARQRDLESLDSGVKRLINPHVYHVSLSEKLWESKQEVIKNLKGVHL